MFLPLCSNTCAIVLLSILVCKDHYYICLYSGRPHADAVPLLRPSVGRKYVTRVCGAHVPTY